MPKRFVPCRGLCGCIDFRAIARVGLDCEPHRPKPPRRVEVREETPAQHTSAIKNVMMGLKGSRGYG